MEGAECQSIMERNGELLRGKEKVKSTWGKYFPDLSFRDDWEDELNCLGKRGVVIQRRRKVLKPVLMRKKR